ncbi:hypothetical protein [Promicromonospora soli]
MRRRTAPGIDQLADEPVTLRVTWWGGDTRHARTQEVFDLFEEKYPDITIEPEFSDWTGYWRSSPRPPPAATRPT